MDAPCQHCGLTADHQHVRLTGGPFDGAVKTFSPGEPKSVLMYPAAFIPDTGETVYPAPLPGGPFEKVRYRLVTVRYRLVYTNFDPGGPDSVVESWPHRDDAGMLSYEFAGTTTYG